ncbi:AraC family transcriptional regulator [Cohnella luojiensis]|uniref:AraC family transcriptional regulator n=1 Tax=Cohnella luojiensis TaxID=652876 RepID=A0A4Y8M2F5_9BACL|nr:AraC family transcriptional regulator [Cohnella luojiensis]TFE29452.1 AraC family transcriptional regulator [Cohnella luojiensis]
MNTSYSRHFVTTEWDRGLPLHLTSVGYSEHQAAINRENGFHSFHWLHTVEGCGEFTVNGAAMKLNPNQGILLKPNVPHSYFPETAIWSTWYMTFDGALANPITASLDIPQMTPLGWDTDCPLANIHEQYSEKCGYSFDFAGINGSLEVYAFLSQIKQYGRSSGQTSLSKGHERLTPIYLLIEEEFGDPNLGLGQLADRLQVSSQYLNTLFRKSWGISPYQYLVQFRIQKSKELLLANRGRTVKEIATAVGFQDDSHFVHTFRKLAGMTPVQFRLQYGE